MVRLRKFFRVYKTLILSIGFLVLFAVTVSYATPPSQPFSPGQTLDPTCAPGDTNCTVTVSPWTTLNNDIYYSAGNVGIGLSTGQLPLYTLSINGTLGASGDTTLDGNTITLGNNTGSPVVNIVARGDTDGLRLYSLANPNGGSVNPPTIGFYRSVSTVGGSPRFRIQGYEPDGADADGFLLSSPSSSVNWIGGGSDGVVHSTAATPLAFYQPSFFTAGTIVVGNDTNASTFPTDGLIRSGEKAYSTGIDDVPGSNLTIAAGGGTGPNTTGGNIYFQTPDTTITTGAVQPVSTKLTLLRSGNVGIGTSSPTTKLDLEQDGSVLAVGTTGSGLAVPNLGAGTRLEWIPSADAFRVGTATGTEWDNANVGQDSIGLGYSAEASNQYSAALGQGSLASGIGSTAFRFGTASGQGSVAFGGDEGSTASGMGAVAFVGGYASGDHSFAFFSLASGSHSTAFGSSTTASGNFSTTFGLSTTAAAYGDTVFGIENVGGGTAGSWIATDPLFEIGNGTVTPSVTNSDAMIVLKNGDTGINLGTGAPSYSLQVGNSSVTGIVARFQNSTGTCDINPTGTALACSSDMNLKTNITNLSDDSTWSFNNNITLANQSILAKVMALNPVNYNWKTEPNGASKHTGFIAQEVRQVFPDLVSQDPSSGLLSLNYIGLIPYTVEAVKEMNVNITSIDDLTKTNTWRDALLGWFGDAGNGIKNFFSHTITTNQLCIKDDAGQTCLTRSQVDQLLQGSGVGGTSSSTSSDPAINTGAGSTQSSDTVPPTPDTASSTDGGTSSDQTQSPQTQSSGVTTPDTTQ